MAVHPYDDQSVKTTEKASGLWSNPQATIKKSITKHRTKLQAQSQPQLHLRSDRLEERYDLPSGLFSQQQCFHVGIIDATCTLSTSKLGKLHHQTPCHACLSSLVVHQPLRI